MTSALQSINPATSRPASFISGQTVATHAKAQKLLHSTCRRPVAAAFNSTTATCAPVALRGLVPMLLALNPALPSSLTPSARQKTHQLPSRLQVVSAKLASAQLSAQRKGTKPLPLLTSLKGVLFDIDGTLTKSDPLHFAAFREILLEKGFHGGTPIDLPFYNEHISGRHNPDIARDLFPDWTIEQHEALTTDKEQRFRRLAASALTPMPGLTEFLRWLDGRQLRKAAVTNAPAENTRVMLEGLGLSDYFEAVVLGEECERAKPHPDPYLKALELLGLQPDQVIIVEDSPSGVEAGVAAGVPVVGITSGQTEERLRAAGASHIITDWHDLLALVPVEDRRPADADSA